MRNHPSSANAKRRIALSSLALCFSAFVCMLSSAFAADDFNYEPDPDFPQLPAHIELGVCTGVAVNSKGEIFMLHRGPHPLICFDANGKFLRSWGDDLLHTGHGLTIDSDDNIWATDTEHHVVFKFNSEGKLLQVLGQLDKKGLGTDQFDQPTDINFGPDGSIYVTDGYGNSRIMKFTSKGQFVRTWGQPGTKPGEFDKPHTVLVDGQGRVLIGDRENDRIQIFDVDGNHLDMWSGFRPFGLVYDSKGTLFVADGRAHRILQLDSGGKVVRSWGGMGSEPGQLNVPHMLAVDAHDNLYVAEIEGRRIQRLNRTD